MRIRTYKTKKSQKHFFGFVDDNDVEIFKSIPYDTKEERDEARTRALGIGLNIANLSSQKDANNQLYFSIEDKGVALGSSLKSNSENELNRMKEVVNKMSINYSEETTNNKEAYKTDGRNDDYKQLSFYQSKIAGNNNGFDLFRDEASKESYFTYNQSGKIVLISEGYSSDAARNNGVSSVSKNMIIPKRYDRQQHENGKYYFNLKAGNHQEIATSVWFDSEAQRDAAINFLESNGQAIEVDGDGVITTAGVVENLDQLQGIAGYRAEFSIAAPPPPADTAPKEKKKRKKRATGPKKVKEPNTVHQQGSYLFNDVSWEIFQSGGNKKFYYKFLKEDGKSIFLNANVQGFVTLEDARTALDTALTLSPSEANFEGKMTKNGKYYFYLKDEDGKSFGKSFFYNTEEDMREAVGLLIGRIAGPTPAELEAERLAAEKAQQAKIAAAAALAAAAAAAKLKAEEEARLKAEQEAKRKAEEEARLKAEQEAKRKAEEEARLKAEQEAKRKAGEEARLKAEQETKQKAIAAAALAAAAAAAKLKADQEAAKLKAEQEAAAKAKIEADKAARLKAEQEAAKLKAEQEAAAKAKLEAERAAKLKEEKAAAALAAATAAAALAAKQKAEKQAARVKAEQEAAAKAKLEAERKAKLRAEEDRKRKEVAAANAAALAAKKEEKRRVAALAATTAASVKATPAKAVATADAGDGLAGCLRKFWWLFLLLLLLLLLLWWFDACGCNKGAAVIGAAEEEKKEQVTEVVKEPVAPIEEVKKEEPKPVKKFGPTSKSLGLSATSAAGMMADYLSDPDKGLPKKFTMDYAYFGFNEATMAPRGKKEIFDFIKVMKAYPNSTIQILGHIDGTESEEYNGKYQDESGITLSAIRARCAYKRLYNDGKGISYSRMTMKGLAGTNQLFPNDTPSNRKKNRRVEIIAKTR